MRKDFKNRFQKQISKTDFKNRFQKQISKTLARLFLCLAFCPVFLLQGCEERESLGPDIGPLGEKTVITRLSAEGNLANWLGTYQQEPTLRKNSLGNLVLFDSIEVRTDEVVKVTNEFGRATFTFLIVEGQDRAKGPRNLIIEEHNGFIRVYIYRYAPANGVFPEDFGSFTGEIEQYNLAGRLLKKVSFLNGEAAPPSNGRRKSSLDDICLEYLETRWVDVNGEECEPLALREDDGCNQVLVYVPCTDELTEALDPGSSDGTLFPGDPGFGEPTLGSGEGKSDPGGLRDVGDIEGGGSTGVMAPVDQVSQTALQQLEEMLAADPHFLIENLPCEEMEAWKQLAQQTPDPRAIKRLEELENNRPWWGDFVPYSEWKIQELEEAEGTTINMDYFSVDVQQLPLGTTADQLLDGIRKNLNKYFDQDVAIFEPYSPEENAIWLSSNPIGAVMRFRVIQFGFQIDKASVICSGHTNAYWQFSTVQSPKDSQHPVSGTREIGYKQNLDGSYTFYTRGVDRVTGTLDNLVQESNNMAFEGADKLWESFQDLVTNMVNNSGGTASHDNSGNDKNKKIGRIDWDKIERYLNGQGSINDFNCN